MCICAHSMVCVPELVCTCMWRSAADSGSLHQSLYTIFFFLEKLILVYVYGRVVSVCVRSLCMCTTHGD